MLIVARDSPKIAEAIDLKRALLKKQIRELIVVRDSNKIAEVVPLKRALLIIQPD